MQRSDELPPRRNATPRRAKLRARICAPRDPAVDRAAFFVGVIAASGWARRRRRSPCSGRGAAVPDRRHRPQPAQMTSPASTAARDGIVAENRQLCVKLGVVVAGDVRLRLRAGAVLREDLRGDRHPRPRQGRRRAQHAGRPHPQRAARIRLQRAQAAVGVPAARDGDRHPSGRGAPGDVRDRQHHRPRGDGPGDSQLRPAGRGRVLPEARVLLLHAADAAARRAAADAGRVRDRSEAAAGHDRR